MILCLLGMTATAAVQYSNDFENPGSANVQTAWPELVISAGGTMQAVNGRIEWDATGGNNDWIRLDQEVPNEYQFEFDFFYQENTNGRFSLWPFCKPGDGITRFNYFLRKNTHYYNLADTVPSEGPRDLTLPIGSKPHRMRVEVTGDHVALLYKDRGEGGWILIDERDFPHVDSPRYIQLGYNHDGGTAGLIYIDNLVLNYRSQNLLSYSNNFDNAPNANVNTSWPEWIIATGGTMQAVNNRIEWDATGGNNDWIRLDMVMPNDYVYEFDLFYQENTNGRFSVWPFCNAGDSISRFNYFVRKNTHYYNLADTVPSEGPRDMTLPVGSPPHRLRVEVTGDHVLLLYKDRGVGGWILIDERNFPHIESPRYIQLGYNHDGGTAGLIYVDNFVVNELAANRATVERSIGAEVFTANTPIPVNLTINVTGNLPSLTVTEGIPEGWSVSNISNGGVVSGGNIIWSFTNQSESLTLTYNAVPPRLVLSRVAGFSGSVDSGEGEERIAGDTAISIKLPYLYRECIDYDFSGSPVDGKNYPTGTEFAVRYCQGMNGILATVPYTRPGGGATPAVNTQFVFQAGADFYFSNPGIARDNPNYEFSDYRDQGEITLEHGASDTNAGIGGDDISVGDWFRYTFDFGPGDQVILINLSVNMWGNANCSIDVYVDNKFKAEFLPTNFSYNAYEFHTVGPFEISGGVHSIVLAIPGPNVPDGIGRMEVVRVRGIGQVTRTLTEEGFFDPSQPLPVHLSAEALYGSYTPFVVEDIPQGTQITDISNGGRVVENKIIWELPATTTSTDFSYTAIPPAGATFLRFNGLADVGLPLAKRVMGDGSVVNEVWLFGGPGSTARKDDFNGSALQAPWVVEYGSDPALNTNYQDRVKIEVSGGRLTFSVDPVGVNNKFDEWANGRRAPLILRTDLPAGDWRAEALCTLDETFTWDQYHVGIFVAYNAGNDTNVSGDEYLLGFYASDLRVEKTNVGSLGNLTYHSLADEFDWLDLVDAGNVKATLAITKRGNQLIFSARMNGRAWELLGVPVTENRTPTRVGFFSKIWGDLNYSIASFDYFTLTELDVFTDVEAWELY
jgi:hypothetical protein